MKIELRNHSVRLSGYVNAVERKSEVLSRVMCRSAPGDFVEIISSGAFESSLKRRPEVALRFNHELDLDSTRGTLQLREDNIGLHAEAVITDPQVIRAGREGRLTGWSFGFTDPEDTWSEADDKGIYTRTITALDLREVSILTKRPAYPATSVEVRDGEARETEYRKLEEETIVTDDRSNELLLQEIEILKLKGRYFYEP